MASWAPILPRHEFMKKNSLFFITSNFKISFKNKMLSAYDVLSILWPVCSECIKLAFTSCSMEFFSQSVVYSTVYLSNISDVYCHLPLARYSTFPHFSWCFFGIIQLSIISIFLFCWQVIWNKFFLFYVHFANLKLILDA